MKTLRNLVVIAIAAGLFSLPASARVEQEKPALPAVAESVALPEVAPPKPLPENPTAPDRMSFSYNVYAGGMHALKADLNLSLGTENYAVGLQAETDGVIGSLFPWRGTYGTKGATHDGKLEPLAFESKSIWKQKVKASALEYDGKGGFVESRTIKNGTSTVDPAVNESLTADTADMLTAAVKLFQASSTAGKCEGKSAVFDGKRRFNIVFKPDGKEIIAPSKYSSFSGEALRCIVEVEPVAGFKPKDMKRGWMVVQEHTRERHKMPTLWLASPAEGAPAVPVRMEIASAYGSVVAHLTGSQTQSGTAASSLKTGSR